MLDRLEQLAREATPGPWDVQEDSCDGYDEAWCEWHRVGPLDLTGKTLNRNTAYIAAADPSTVLKLIAVVKAAQQAQETMRHGIEYQPWESTETYNKRRAAFAALRLALVELERE